MLKKIAILVSLALSTNFYINADETNTQVGSKPLKFFNTISNQTFSISDFAQLGFMQAELLVTGPISVLKHIFINRIDTLKPYTVEDYNSKKPGYDFKGVVTFGDSNSDGGEARVFIAGPPENYKHWHEYISEKYTGKESVPGRLGGLNFSRASERINMDPTDEWSALLKINEYLDRNQGRADKDSIYLYWVGANNIFGDAQYEMSDAVIGYRVKDFIQYTLHPETRVAPYNVPFGNILALFQPIEWKKINASVAQNQYVVSDSPQVVRTHAQILLDAGAGFVAVGTLAPYYTNSLTANILFMPTSIFWYAQSRNSVQPWLDAVDSKLRPLNIKGEDQLINSVVSAIASTMFISEDSVRKFYVAVYQASKDLITQFNNQLIRELDTLSGNVIVFDAQTFFTEVINDPNAYGIDSIAVPACTLGYFGSTGVCRGGYAYHDDKVYLTSDLQHFSNEGNLLLAEYFMSIFDAPNALTTLIPNIYSFNNTRQQFLSSQLKSKHNIEHSAGDQDIFGGYSLQRQSQIEKSANENFLHLGYQYFLTPKTSVGGLLTIGNGKLNNDQLLQYRFTGQAATLFMEQKYDNGWNLFIDGYFTHYQAKDIKRQINIGKKHYQETSDTTAYSLGFDADGTYFIPLNENIKHGPVVGLNIQGNHIKGMREKGERSTAMHFDSYNYYNVTPKIGWTLETQDYPVNGFLEVTYQKNLINKKVKFGSAINRMTKANFKREIENPIDSSVALNTGISYNPTDQVRLNASYQKNWNKSQKDTQIISLGINYAIK